ncbi:MAG TPA: glycine cleavage system aminomethyltransferase GcvT [Chthoniobacteraceae bacterium]|nr:glycine cleavage system aminomethyltransferase GcvT [Chthoniobacteraceae bacterium]
MSAESSSPLRQTPLHAAHVALGARMVDFGGWSMPVQYTGILDEHQAVRGSLGVFDISHMGQFFARGPGAAAWLNGVLTNNVDRLGVGECQYTFLLNERGGVIDDLIVYRIKEADFLLVVNAAKIEEDFAWMQQQLGAGVAGVEFENRSADFAGLAVQGPRSAQLFDAFFGRQYSRPARNEILSVEIDGFCYYIARTGYTGEDGFEVFCEAPRAVKTWNDILRRGAEFGIKPCGLGARDTLRLEMCYPLNGSDLSPARTPLEAGLSIFVDLNKPSFVGREVLVKQRAEGIKHRLVPFVMQGKTPPPRAHYPIYKNGALIGETTSGTQSPTLGVGIGMAYIPTEFARLQEPIEIDIRGKRFPAIIEKKPLHHPSKTPA